MTYLNRIGATFFVVSELSALSTAAAYAALPEFKASKFPIAFSGTGGKARMETEKTNVFGEKRFVECAAYTKQGEVLNSTEVKIAFKFTGCKSASGSTCTSPGAKAGEVITNALVGKLICVKSTEPKEVGMLAAPEIAGGVFATLKCEGGLYNETFTVKGSATGKLTPINTLTNKFTLALKEKGGK